MTNLDEALLQILNDKQSGSIAILQQLIRGISSYLIRESNPSMSLNIVHDRLPLMRGGLGHFAVVGHFLNELENVTANNLKDSKSQEALFDFVKQYDNRWKNANSEVAGVAAGNIHCHNKTILLHSNSSVITSFFSKLKSMSIMAAVVQTESRPENEGRYQALKIANLGFNVKYVVDTAASFMMDDVDMMITGADQIHKNYYVNKIGTYALALLCREKNIPVHVLADSRKISNTDANPQALHNIKRSGSDIWKSSPERISPINFYFEPIPTNLVTSFITEKGIHTPANFMAD
jgi:translation initiation factor 2B subunit (eIF-2B alpha/beta/delta family)